VLGWLAAKYSGRFGMEGDNHFQLHADVCACPAVTEKTQLRGFQELGSSVFSNLLTAFEKTEKETR
jgi:hypothetical protein